MDTGLLYTSVADRLRESILGGQYRAGDLIGSEHGLARESGISRMTVRRASEILIGEGLVERRPGKGLYVRSRGSTIQHIQLVAGNLQWERNLLVARGAQAIARERRIQVQLYDAHGDVEMDLDMLSKLPQSPSQGGIIISLHSSPFVEAAYKLKTAGFPFVLVDHRLRDIDVPSVTSDNYTGGYLAGQHLLERGHRRVGFIGDLIAATTQDRLAGLRDAVGDAGLPFSRSHVMDVQAASDRMGVWSQDVRQNTVNLLSRPDRPTAILFSCDAVAREAYAAIAELGLRIPDDVSVVGFDDDPLASWLTPKLTTVRQPFLEIGQRAMAMLCEQIADPARKPAHVVMPVQLVVRESTAAPKPTLL